MSTTRMAALVLLGIAWLVLIVMTLRFQARAWAHRTQEGREHLRWDRPRFRWFVIADPGARGDFDDVGWRYRNSTLWCLGSAIAVMIIAWVVTW